MKDAETERARIKPRLDLGGVVLFGKFGAALVHNRPVYGLRLGKSLDLIALARYANPEVLAQHLAEPARRAEQREG
ncbi:hypothetical protein WPS_18530 [Vulcanimicrobium alpinum]|uniref:Uncharacterized protein n=1 Tax=Vulcanimicrobium alpinum TaxID=3016050 RepID=A0AAN1XYH6_UNVUL|nr:hypothetical protein WPS_18530 [Vulcanimicrobium alpinum]